MRTPSRPLAILAAWTLCAASAPAYAALETGTTAPDFTLPATLGGKDFSFSLADALKRGPVVLYFYPAAFTRGCTIEAHEFADAMDRFKALGATVIGVSADDIAKLDRFSVSECLGRFPVAADRSLRVIGAYGVSMPGRVDLADRVSFVIDRHGRIVQVIRSPDPDRHVSGTLAALKALD